MTNGGKTTLSTNLQEVLPNSCVISQDVFFKVPRPLCKKVMFLCYVMSYVSNTYLTCLYYMYVLLSQDDSMVPVDSNGFKQYDSKNKVDHMCSSHIASH